MLTCHDYHDYRSPESNRPFKGHWILSLAVALVLTSGSCSLVGNEEATDSSTTTQTEPVGSSAVSSTVASTTTASPASTSEPSTTAAVTAAVTGAQSLIEDDSSVVAGQRIGLIANQTALVDGQHLVDLMAESPDFNLVAVFGPEHGFRGTGDAGEATGNDVDPATGLPVFSLYGATRKPTPAMLEGIDVLVYDIADVGTRFYTFISTMGLAMQAAAEADISFVVLDRPNPNPGPISGFVRTPDQDSFISQYPIPSVYGLTAGELAMAIAGEGWLPGLENLDLTVIPVAGWTRSTPWPDNDWVAPSPGLPTLETARTYPGIVLFEATSMSLGRGTDAPFTQVGAPWLDPDVAIENLATYQDHPVLAGMGAEATTFTPRRLDYMTADPIYLDQTLPAVRVYSSDVAVAVGVALLVELQRQATEAGVTLIDRPTTFDLLAGTTQLRTMVESGASADEIIAAWSDEAAAFSALVDKYRIYLD